MVNVRQSSQGMGGSLFGFAVLVLLLLGVLGTLYKLLAPSGWIVQMLNRNTSAGFAAFFAVGTLGLLAWFMRGYGSPRSRNHLADLFVYGFAGAGVIYMARYWLTGVF